MGVFTLSFAINSAIMWGLYNFVGIEFCLAWLGASISFNFFNSK